MIHIVRTRRHISEHNGGLIVCFQIICNCNSRIFGQNRPIILKICMGTGRQILKRQQSKYSRCNRNKPDQTINSDDHLNLETGSNYYDSSLSSVACNRLLRGKMPSKSSYLYLNLNLSNDLILIVFYFTEWIEIIQTPAY